MTPRVISLLVLRLRESAAPTPEARPAAVAIRRRRALASRHNLSRTRSVALRAHACRAVARRAARLVPAQAGLALAVAEAAGRAILSARFQSLASHSHHIRRHVHPGIAR